MYYMILPTEKKRNELIKKFKDKKIEAPFHYIPLHISPMGEKFGYKKGDLPLTESYSSRLIRLPLFPDMTNAQVKEVLEVLKEYFEGENEN